RIDLRELHVALQVGPVEIVGRDVQEEPPVEPGGFQAEVVRPDRIRGRAIQRVILDSELLRQRTAGGAAEIEVGLREAARHALALGRGGVKHPLIVEAVGHREARRYAVILDDTYVGRNAELGEIVSNRRPVGRTARVEIAVAILLAFALAFRVAHAATNTELVGEVQRDNCERGLRVVIRAAVSRNDDTTFGQDGESIRSAVYVPGRVRDVERAVASL